MGGIIALLIVVAFVGLLLGVLYPLIYAAPYTLDLGEAWRLIIQRWKAGTL